MNGTCADPPPAGRDAVLLEGLFGTPGVPGETALWQRARKSGHLLVLARREKGGLAAALRWYRALRPPGRAYRFLLTTASRSPLWRFLPALELVAGTDGFLARFERESGRRVTAILFGNPVQRHRRVVLRAERADGPAWVVKAGFSAEAVEAIAREAAVLAESGGEIPGVPEVMFSASGPEAAAFATEEIAGEPLRDPDQQGDAAVALVRSWTRFGERRDFSEFAAWSRVAAAWPRSMEPLRERIGKIRLATAFSHGDFAAWNLLAGADKRLRAVDWEWAELRGVPGWDLVHYFWQDQVMVRREGGADGVLAALSRLRQPAVADYFAECGWPGPELAFATYACALNPIFRGPDRRAVEAMLKGGWD